MSRTVAGFQRNRPWHRGYSQQVGGGSAPAPWTPDDVLAGVTNAFWADPLAGTLYEDAALTTLADATGDPIGGVDNQSSIGTSTLSQATTADKFKLAADGRMERDNTVTTQKLLLGSMAIQPADGFCFAVDFDSVTGSSFLGHADGSQFYIGRSSDILIMRVGGGTGRSVAGVFTASNRRRIIVTGNSTDYAVYSDGVLVATFATETSLINFNNLAVGTRGPTSTLGAATKYGRFLIAEKDLRSEAARLDAWLAGA